MRLLDTRNPQLRAELRRAGIRPLREKPWDLLFPPTPAPALVPIVVTDTAPIPRVRARRHTA